MPALYLWSCLAEWVETDTAAEHRREVQHHHRLSSSLHLAINSATL